MGESAGEMDLVRGRVRVRVRVGFRVRARGRVRVRVRVRAGEPNRKARPVGDACLSQMKTLISTVTTLHTLPITVKQVADTLERAWLR